jgi:hypothetical protein
VILEPSLGGVERVAKRDVDVFVGMVEVVVAVDHDLATWDDELDADRVEAAATVVAVGLGHDDVAAGDAVGEPLEVGHVLERRGADVRIDGQIVERHLRLGLHDGTPVGRTITRRG